MGGYSVPSTDPKGLAAVEASTLATIGTVIAPSGISTQDKSAGNSRITDAEARCRHELDAQREEFGRELARKAYTIAKLEQDLLEVRKVYETSLSWRLTSPLRLFKELLPRRRG